jgi:hypothetical protein
VRGWEPSPDDIPLTPSQTARIALVFIALGVLFFIGLVLWL